MDVLLTTDSLSQLTLAGPDIGTPNIRNLYRKLSINSVAILNAVIYDPKVDISTVFSFFEYYITGAMLIMRIIPI